MSRWVRWCGVAAIVVVLPLLAAAVAIAVADINDYKPQIAAAVSRATGRDVTLDGPMRVVWSLSPTIEATDVKLGNLAGGTRPDIARAELIKLQLSLPPLLWRRLEVIKLTLVGPNILFELVHGQRNWEFKPDAGAKLSSSAPPGGSLGASGSVRFRNVIVQNGMVTWRSPARTKVVGIRSLDLQNLTDDGPLTLLAALVYSDYQSFTIHASAQPISGSDHAWDTQLQFAANDAAATAHGKMNLAGDYDLQISATAGALEKLNALLPDMHLPALHQVTVETRVSNGLSPGDLPVIGATKLHLDSADLGNRVPGLTLGAVDVTLPAAGTLATLSGNGKFRGQAFTLGGSFGVPQHPDAQVTLPIDLTVQTSSPGGDGKVPDGANGSLGVKGTIALQKAGFDGLDAHVALRMPGLAAFRPTLSPMFAALTHVSLDGQLIVPADRSALRLHDAKLSAQQAEVTGDATIGLGQAVALDATLNANRLDLDALLVPSRTTDAPPAQSMVDDSSRWIIPDTPLAWPALRGPTIALKAKVAALTLQRQMWRNVELALQLNAARLQVNRLQIALPGGPLAMSLTADASGDDVPVEFALHGDGVPLALIGHYAGLPGPMNGAIKLDAQMHASGGSLHALAASLDGSVSAAMNGGSMSNAVLRKLVATPLEALSIVVPAQGETTISCLGLTGAFSKGIGRVSNIAVATTYLDAGGTGQVNLAAETVALKLHTLAQVSGSLVSVPVLVEGPFRTVQGRLDANGFDKLGLVIDAWTGGNRPDPCLRAGFLSSQAGR